MPLSPQDVAAKQFTVVRLTQGYKMDEVDAFLDEVEGELGRLVRDNDELRMTATRTGTAPAAAPAVAEPAVVAPTPEPAAAPVAPPPPAVAAAPPPTDSAVRMLELAQRTADQAVAEAKAEAQRILDAARGEHARMASDLEGQRTALQAKVDELRAFEREYRTRLRSYLESQLRDLEARGGAAPASPPSSTTPPAPSTPPSAPPPAPAVSQPPPPVSAPSGPPAPSAPIPVPHSAPPAGPPSSQPPAPPPPPSRPFSPVPSPVSDTPAAPPVQPD